MNIVDTYKLLFGRKGIQDGDVIELAEHGRQGGISTGQGFKTVGTVLHTYRTASDATYVYHGLAKPGTATSDALWRVLVEDTSGNILFADGDDNFNNIWDNYSSLSYS